MGQGSGQSHRLAPAERWELLRLVRSGETYQAAARVVGCSSKSVQRLLARTGGIKSRSTPRSALRLSPAEREEISRGLLAGESCQRIATRLHRAPSSLSREVTATVDASSIARGGRTLVHVVARAARKLPCWCRRRDCGVRSNVAFVSDGHRSRYQVG